jgi:hypothetical protein
MTLQLTITDENVKYSIHQRTQHSKIEVTRLAFWLLFQELVE